MSSLTAYLLDPNTDPTAAELFTQATTHPFLANAGRGTLPAKTLLKWLAQDVLYTRAYVRFIGAMLKQLHLPSSIKTESPTSQTSLQFRIFDLLVGALTNIQFEMRFFEDACTGCGLKLDAEASAEPVTRAFADTLETVADRGVLQGLVMLWTTEMCYLKAWRFALDQQAGSSSETENQAEDDEEAKARRLLREKLIPRWSTDEFEVFVNECRDLVNEVAREELGTISTELKSAGQQTQVANDESLLKDCEEVFHRVIWLESGFWPDA